MAKDKSKNGKKGRRAYLNDIQPNLSGEYVYTGAHYRYAGPEDGYRRAAGMTGLYSLLCLAGFVAAGCCSAGGMGNCFYVIIPYIAEAVALMVTLYAVVRMLLGGSRLREYVHASTVKRVPVGALCAAALSALGLVCVLVFTACNGADGSAVELAVLIAAKLLTAFSALLLRRHVRTIPWKKEQ